MLADFSIAPLGRERGLSADVARIERLVADSGLPHQLHAMGTLVEGPAETVFDLVRCCHAEMRRHHRRVVTSLRIDDCEGREGMLHAKVASVEAQLGQGRSP